MQFFQFLCDSLVGLIGSQTLEFPSQFGHFEYIYKGLKPVYWCPTCDTALAEAEIEYAEDPCHSIYVKFNVIDDQGGKLEALQ